MRGALKRSPGRDLPPLVPLAIESDNVRVSTDAVLADIPTSEHQQIIGPSGCGKSLLARHIAQTAVRRGRLAIVAPARDYNGKLSALLDRSVAHLHPETALQLMRAAERVGTPLLLILDGFNECARRWQQNLLRDLHAFSLRSPGVPILITAHEPLSLSEPLMSKVLRFAPLTRRDKVAVLRAYATDRLPSDAEAFVESFQTPFEISLAAGCLEEPACLVSRGALLDAYIRRRCEATANPGVVRRMLGAIAARMHQRLASSLPLSEVRQVAAKVLREANVPTQPLADALSCGLLDARQSRASFRHELLERALQSEALTARHGSGPDLALALMMPRNRSLVEFVVSLEADPEAIRRCLEAVADPTILTECLRGRYGDGARDVAIEESTHLIEAARRALEHTTVALTGSETWKTLDVTEGPVWPPYDRALMQAVGRMLPEGLFVEEAFRLIAQTEKRCLAVLSRTDGSLAPADAMSLFAGLYVFTRGGGNSVLPASIIYQAS